jgi:hypothetical protein
LHTGHQTPVGQPTVPAETMDAQLIFTGENQTTARFFITNTLAPATQKVNGYVRPSDRSLDKKKPFKLDNKV